ncbi:MAG TPA: hypothetical protein VGB53_05875 [Rubricoccaceae bacterium]
MTPRRPLLALAAARIAAALLAAVPLGAALAGCVRTPPPGLPEGVTVEDLPDAETWGARLRTTEAGRPTLDVDAPYLARYRRAPAEGLAAVGVSPADPGDSSAVFLGPPPDAAAGEPAARISVRLYDAAGTPVATVTAERAWLHEATGRLVAEGRAEATGGDGARVTAARIAATRDGDVTASGGATAAIGGARVEAARISATRGGAFTATGGATATLSGRANATVRAQTLRGAAGGARYEAAGGARVDAASGRRLDSGLVVWDESAGRFRAPGAFTFDGPGERVRGVGLDAAADLTRYSFRRASGQIEVRQ